MNVEDFNQLILNEILVEDVEDAIEQAQVPRDLLDKRDPFSLSDHKFVRLFRLSKDLCRDVVEMVTPFVIFPSRQSALTITTKVRYHLIYMYFSRHIHILVSSMLLYNLISFRNINNFATHTKENCELKVLATLRFYASGSYQEVTGSNSFVGISQPSTSRAIVEITNALNEAAIINRFIKYPQTIEELEAIRLK